MAVDSRSLSSSFSAWTVPVSWNDCADNVFIACSNCGCSGSATNLHVEARTPCEPTKCCTQARSHKLPQRVIVCCQVWNLRLTICPNVRVWDLHARSKVMSGQENGTLPILYSSVKLRCQTQLRCVRTYKCIRTDTSRYTRRNLTALLIVCSAVRKATF